MRILWDFDGTLATCGSIWPAVFTDLTDLSANEATNAWQDWQKTFPWIQHGTPHAQLFRGCSYYEYLLSSLKRTLKVLGYDRRLTADDLRQSVVRHLQYRLLPGTLDVLERVRSQGHVSYLASNHVPDLPTVLESLSIAGFFERQFISGVIGHEKPSKGFWDLVDSSLGGAPQTTLMIGDDWQRDIQPALERGYHAILVGIQQLPNTVSASRALKIDGLPALFSVLAKFSPAS